MPNPNDYTVGWISAISAEYVAAQEFFDEEHERPEFVSPNDNNDYTLGRLGNHNVVMAVLPDGEYGTASAASVATNMLHSFPNVRIGLMVGIGGGAPSGKHDIRLGDIVVSAPRDGKSGVLQYDFGKTIQGQKFQEIKFLNQPPTLLRTAMSGLKTQYERKGHLLEEVINSVLDRNPRLRRKYKRPEPSTDRLHQSTATHPLNDSSSCAAVCSDDPSNLILRPERTEDEDNPTIHYGLIASANQLIKDALVRDRLAAEKEVLCFEMEAGGLMNHFPCLVIRGICDYSDSHKNKEWQGYAAMAAAAYAKDLLHRIPPNKVEAEKRISDILSDVQSGVNEIVSGQRDQKHDAVLEWFTPIDYASQQNDLISRRQKGTGQWLLNSDKFRQWVHEDNRTLFCPGIPGAGKTMSTAIVIDELHSTFQNDLRVGVSYVYCNFRRQYEQRPRDLFVSLLKQLVRGLPSMPEIIKQLYEQHQPRKTYPVLDEILQTLQFVLHSYRKVFIVVDALDECQVSDGGRKQFLSELLNLQAKTAVNLLVTSRFIPEIEEEFDSKSVKLEIRASDEDVLKYLDGHIQQKLPSFVSDRADLQEEIKIAILKAAAGMFLLAQLDLDSLVGKRSPKAIRSALKKLPKGSDAYDEAYRDTMKRIEAQVSDSKTLAMQVLSWITCAKRPLTSLELRHALAVEVGEPQLDEENLPEAGDMVSVCAGLVIVDEESKVIRLVHYTTQEFFERTNKDWFPDAEADIADVCIAYLSFEVFESGFCQSDEEYEARIQSNPLYDYAAGNWGHHFRESDIRCQEVKFLESEAKVSASSQVLMATTGYRYGNYSQNIPKRIKGAHLGAWFGLKEMVAMIIENGNDLNCRDSYGRTPLSYAAANGHEAVVRLLLATGQVDVDSKDGYGRTPLSYAAANGHEAVVRLLLATGQVDVDFKDGYGRTPLSYAAANGHAAVVKLLESKTTL